jgi:hypothetical protein
MASVMRPSPMRGLGLARRLSLGLVLGVVVLLVGGVAPAFALSTHVFSSSLGSSGVGAGQVSNASADSCPNEALRVGASAALPDCRAYEMVSPLGKNGVDISTGEQVNQTNAVRISDSGNAVTYSSSGAFPGSPSAGLESVYLGRRGPVGWTYQSLAPPLPPGSFSTMLFDDALPDLSEVIFQAKSYPPADPNIYVRDSSSGALRLVTTAGPVSPDPNYRPEFGAASSDFSHIVLNSADPLALGDPAGVKDLYDSVNGQLHLVNVRPDGTPDAGGAVLGGGGRNNAVHQVSSDGSRVFFTSNSDEQLYVRENDAQPQSPLGVKGECTVPADACTVQASNPADPTPALFQAASANGSKVFFTQSAHLYRYDTVSGVRDDLTPTIEGFVGYNISGGNQQRGAVVGASEDGSLVYFYVFGQLNGQGVAGRASLFLYRSDTTPAETTLVATETGGESGRVPLFETSTPDGKHLAFDSLSSLKTVNWPEGYDNTDVSTGLPDEEVFLYDANTGSLRCASCNPSGARPTGDAKIGYSRLRSEDSMTFAPPRSFSDDGSRLFFHSPDALVPGDTNGQLDVYEYEQGQVHLISSGTSPGESLFLGATPTGNDAFFITPGQLVSQDTDGLMDLYDARVGGGLPRASVPVCTGTGCQGVPGAPPIFATPSSVTFNGVGNFPPPSPESTVKGRARSLTRAQRLARALSACRSKRKALRARCRAAARKRYGRQAKAHKGGK